MLQGTEFNAFKTPPPLEKTLFTLKLLEHILLFSFNNIRTVTESAQTLASLYQPEQSAL